MSNSSECFNGIFLKLIIYAQESGDKISPNKKPGNTLFQKIIKVGFYFQNKLWDLKIWVMWTDLRMIF